MTAELTTIQTLQNDLSALESRRAEIAREIEAARGREAAARDAMILAPSGEVSAELRAASIEADSLQSVAAEIERRIEAATVEVEVERQKEARAAALVDLQNHASKWEASEAEARKITEEIAAALAIVPGLYESFEALVEDAAQISKAARVLGFDGADVPGLSGIEAVNSTLLFARLVDGIEGKEVRDDIELVIESSSRRVRLKRQNELNARVLGFGTI
jgi:hypothetical protein